MLLYLSSGFIGYLVGLPDDRVDFASHIAFEAADDLGLAHSFCGSSTQVPLCSQIVAQPDDDYSVPVAFGHRDVLVRGYVDEVVISCGTEVIARHRRSYEHDDFVFNPLHYLALLEQKTGALDQAAPLAGWDLPEEYGRLRRLQESRMGRPGKREFVRVLRLLETFPADEVHAAVQDAISRGATGYDAVKHLLLCRIEGRPPRLDLDLHPHLPSVSVSTTSAQDYMKLLREKAS